MLRPPAGWTVGEVAGFLLPRRLSARTDPFPTFPLQLLPPELCVCTRLVAHPLSRPAVANVLPQEGVPVPPLVHVDATVPAPDEHLQCVVPASLLRQVKTHRHKLRGAEDPRLLSPFERLRPRVLVAPVGVLCPLCRGPRWRHSLAGSLGHLWHGRTTAQDGGANMGNIVYTWRPTHGSRKKKSLEKLSTTSTQT